MTFKSSHSNVARVNNLGVVTGLNFSGLASRDVIITAYPNANPSLIETFELTIEKVFPTRVTLAANPSVIAGNSMNITPTFTPSDTTDRQLIWTTSNSEMATVSSAGDTGLIVGKFSGTVTITATSVMDDSIVATISITVLPAPLFSPAQWAAFLQFVRKGIGHFSLNFVNGVLGFLTFYVYINPKKFKHLWVSIGVGIPLSMVHEALQFLAPGRTPAWIDAFYNTSGYLTAQILMVLFVLLIEWRLRRQANSRPKT
jgi:VanZ family protein